MKTRVLAVLVVLAAACSETPKQVPQGSLVKEAQAATPVDSTIPRLVSDLKAEYQRLVAEDSTIGSRAKSRAAVGFAESETFCQYYGQVNQWLELGRKVRAAPHVVDSLPFNDDMLRGRFIASVKMAAMTSTKKNSSAGYPTQGCSESELSVITQTLEWIVEAGFDPDSIGFDARSIRRRAAELLAVDVRDALKKGDEGILVCECESMTPYYYGKYKFTRTEMGLTEEEWRKANTRPKG